jgi:hypothetical protein
MAIGRWPGCIHVYSTRDFPLNFRLVFSIVRNIVPESTMHIVTWLGGTLVTVYRLVKMHTQLLTATAGAKVGIRNL